MKTFSRILMFMVVPVMAFANGVPLVFSIPSEQNPSNTFVNFVTVNTNFSGMYRDASGTAHSLVRNTNYSLATLISPVSVGGGAPSNHPAVLISNFISGRIYFNYGAAGLVNISDGYRPAAQTPADPNYKTRWAYLEPTVENSKFTGNLSYIDMFAFSISLEAINAPHAVNNPQLSAHGKAFAEATAATSIGVGSNILPDAGAMLPSTNFARIIAPQLRGDLYTSWSNYLKGYLPGKTNTLKGLFAGVGTQPSGHPLTQMQTYEFKVTFDTNGNAHLKAQPGSGDGYTHVSAPNRGPGVWDTNQSVTITFAVLDSIKGIYGNDPSYTVTNNGVLLTNTASIVNDYFGWVVGDLMAGLSFGYLSSTVDFRGTAIGDLYSAQWWGGYTADGTKIDITNTPAGHAIYFGKAQPDHPANYHRYAASIEPLTSGYGFALQDRPGKNLLELLTSTDTSGYLLITLNPDEDPETPLFIHTVDDAVVLSWPASKTNFLLRSESKLIQPVWTPVGVTPVVADGYLVVTSPISGSVQFYRLED